MEIRLHSRENSGEKLLVDEFGEGLGTILAEPENIVGTGGTLADQATGMFCKCLTLSLCHEEFEDLTAQAGLGGAGETEHLLLPILGEGVRESLEDSPILGGWNFCEDFSQLGWGIGQE